MCEELAPKYRVASLCKSPVPMPSVMLTLSLLKYTCDSL